MAGIAWWAVLIVMATHHARGVAAVPQQDITASWHFRWVVVARCFFVFKVPFFLAYIALQAGRVQPPQTPTIPWSSYPSPTAPDGIPLPPLPFPSHPHPASISSIVLQGGGFGEREMPLPSSPF
jgi:hypothetical protein